MMQVTISFIRDCGHIASYTSPNEGFQKWSEQEAAHEIALANPCNDCGNPELGSYRKSKSSERDKYRDTEDF